MSTFESIYIMLQFGTFMIALISLIIMIIKLIIKK